MTRRRTAAEILVRRSIFILTVGRTWGEALAAVHGLATAWLEWDLCGLSACTTDRFEHFARTVINWSGVVTPSTRIATGLLYRSTLDASRRFVSKALACVEFLFADCEYEGCVAIDAGEVLFLVHGLGLPDA